MSENSRKPRIIVIGDVHIGMPRAQLAAALALMSGATLIADKEVVRDRPAPPELRMPVKETVSLEPAPRPWDRRRLPKHLRRRRR